MDPAITIKEFFKAAKEFVYISDQFNDGWIFAENEDLYKIYLRKETYINTGSSLLKGEFIVFYNISYGVPAFSFNVWKSSGELLTLDDVRHLCAFQINQKDFYSVVTQQEHPLFWRPYFIVHPCHTESLLATLKDNSQNIIVTFLGLIVPLLPQLKLRLEYGLLKNVDSTRI